MARCDSRGAVNRRPSDRRHGPVDTAGDCARSFSLALHGNPSNRSPFHPLGVADSVGYADDLYLNLTGPDPRDAELAAIGGFSGFGTKVAVREIRILCRTSAPHSQHRFIERRNLFSILDDIARLPCFS